MARGTEIGHAYVRISTDDSQLERGLRDAQTKTKSSLTSIGQDMVKTGGVLSAAITAPVVGFGVTALNVARQFESGMNQVRAVTGATGGDLEGLENQAKELGRTTQFSAGQAAEAMGFLGMAGFEANEIIAAMPSTLQLAAAANIDLGRAADITSNILTGYGLDIEDLGNANDVLVASMTRANVDLNQLGDAFKFVGPVAKAAGWEFEETATAIALMGNAGIQGGMAGTSLRGAMTRLLNPTKQVQEAMNRLGLDLLDANGNVVGLEEMLRQLEDSGASAGDMMLIFGQRAGPAMAALVEQGADAARDFRAGLDDVEGVAQRISEVQMEGLSGSLLRLRSAFEGLAIAVAESGLIDFASDFVAGLAGVLTRLAETNPELLKLITIVAGIAAAAGPALVILGSVAIAIGALSGPILIVAAAATAVAVAFGLMAVDAERLPGPLGAIVRLVQTLAGSLPAVAAGFGLVIAALAVAKVIAFTGTLMEMNRIMLGFGGTSRVMARALGSTLVAAFSTPMGAAIGLSLAIVGIDQAMRHFTGAGLIDKFRGGWRDAQAAAEGAEQATHDLRIQMLALGRTEIDFEIIRRAIDNLLHDFQRLDREIEEHGLVGMYAYREEIGRVTGAMEEHGKRTRELLDNGQVTIADVIEEYERLDGRQQEAFANGVDMAAVWEADIVRAGEAAAAIFDEVGHSQGEWNKVTEATVQNTKIQMDDWVRSMDLVENAAGDTFGEAIPAVLRIFGEISEETFEGFKGEIPPAIDSAESFRAFLVDKLGAEGGEAFDQLAQASKEAFDGIKDTIAGFLPTVEETFAEWKERLDGLVNDHLNFETNLTTIYNGLAAANVEMTDEIVATVHRLGPEYAASFAEMFAENPEAAIQELRRIAPIITQDMGDEMLATILGFESATEMNIKLGYVDPLQRGIDSAKQPAVDKVAETAQAMLDELAAEKWINNIRANANRLGISFQDGLAMGIANREARNRIDAQIDALGAHVVNRTEMYFGIQSPSKLMAERVGQPIVEGIAVGIEQGTPLVVEAARRSAMNIADEFAAAMNSGEDVTFDQLTAWMRGLGTIIENTSFSSPVNQMAQRLMADMGGIRDLMFEGGQDIGAAVSDGFVDGIGDIAGIASGIISDLIFSIRDAAGEISAADLFGEILGQSDIMRDLVTEFGDLGADIAYAFGEAIADRSPSNIRALARVVDKMIDEAIASGDEGAIELAGRLADAIAAALEFSSPEAVQAVLDFLGELTDVMADAGEEGGEKAGRSMVDGFLDGWNDAKREKDLIETFGSDGKRMIDAINKAIEDGSDGAWERVGSLAQGILDRLTEGMDPDDAAYITKLFTDMIIAVIAEEGGKALDMLKDMLKQIQEGGIESVLPQPTTSRPPRSSREAIEQGMIRTTHLHDFIGRMGHSTDDIPHYIRPEDVPGFMDQYGIDESIMRPVVERYGIDWSDVPHLDGGMPYVPYDNFPALLHQGERVLTAQENRGLGGATVNLTIQGPGLSELAHLIRVSDAEVLA